MRLFATVNILFLLVFNDLKSQLISDSLSTNFFNVVVPDYFATRHTQDSVYFFLRDSIPLNIKTDYNNFKLCLIDQEDAYPLIKKGKMSSLFWARMRIISSDTVDIVIGGWTVASKRTFRFQKTHGKRKLILRNYNFAAWDGGPLGYLPNARFIYDPDSGDWKYFTQEYLIKQKLDLSKKQ